MLLPLQSSMNDGQLEMPFPDHVTIQELIEAQVGIAAINTALTFLGLVLLHVPSKLVLSAIVFFCSFIPVLGVVLPTVPICAVALTQGGIPLALQCVGMVVVYSRTSVRRFGEEDLELLVSLASAAALRIRNVELAEQAAARRVQDRELALAHDIQMAMLPREMPQRPEVEVAAALIPARAVGGDLYDFLVIGDALWFVVADAAGKGVSAALFMAMTQTLFQAHASAERTVGAIMARVNDALWSALTRLLKTSYVLHITGPAHGGRAERLAHARRMALDQVRLELPQPVGRDPHVRELAEPRVDAVQRGLAGGHRGFECWFEKRNLDFVKRRHTTVRPFPLG